MSLPTENHKNVPKRKHELLSFEWRENQQHSCLRSLPVGQVNCGNNAPLLIPLYWVLILIETSTSHIFHEWLHDPNLTLHLPSKLRLPFSNSQPTFAIFFDFQLEFGNFYGFHSYFSTLKIIILSFRRVPADYSAE